MYCSRYVCASAALTKKSVGRPGPGRRARSMEGDQCPFDTDALPAANVRRQGGLSVVSGLFIFAKKVSGLKALKDLEDWEFGVRGGKEGDISHKGLMRGRGQVRRRSASFKC